MSWKIANQLPSIWEIVKHWSRVDDRLGFLDDGSPDALPAGCNIQGWKVPTTTSWMPGVKKSPPLDGQGQNRFP